MPEIKFTYGMSDQQLAEAKTIYAANLLQGQRALITGGGSGIGGVSGLTQNLNIFPVEVFCFGYFNKFIGSAVESKAFFPLAETAGGYPVLLAEFRLGQLALVVTLQKGLPLGVGAHDLWFTLLSGCFPQKLSS